MGRREAAWSLGALGRGAPSGKRRCLTRVTARSQSGKAEGREWALPRKEPPGWAGLEGVPGEGLDGQPGGLGTAPAYLYSGGRARSSRGSVSAVSGQDAAAESAVLQQPVPPARAGGAARALAGPGHRTVPAGLARLAAESPRLAGPLQPAHPESRPDGRQLSQLPAGVAQLAAGAGARPEGFRQGKGGPHTAPPFWGDLPGTDKNAATPQVQQAGVTACPALLSP